MKPIPRDRIAKLPLSPFNSLPIETVIAFNPTRTQEVMAASQPKFLSEAPTAHQEPAEAIVPLDPPCPGDDEEEEAEGNPHAGLDAPVTRAIHLLAAAAADHPFTRFFAKPGCEGCFAQRLLEAKRQERMHQVHFCGDQEAGRSFGCAALVAEVPSEEEERKEKGEGGKEGDPWDRAHQDPKASRWICRPDCIFQKGLGTRPSLFILSQFSSSPFFNTTFTK
jgi:hypothetical protein